MELFKIKHDIPFMSYGRLTTTISGVTFLLAVLFLAIRGLNLGIDFMRTGFVTRVLTRFPPWNSWVRRLLDSLGPRCRRSRRSCISRWASHTREHGGRILGCFSTLDSMVRSCVGGRRVHGSTRSTRGR